MKGFKYTAIAFSLALGCVNSSFATEQYGPTYGGNGGTEFEQGCNTGSMSGMQIRSGSRVDAVGARCYQDSPINNFLNGGNGGSLSIADCSGTTPYVKGIRGRSGSEVDRLGLLCTDSNKISSKTMQEYGGNGGGAFSYSCASGFSVKGLQGRSGRRVDKIGVICSNRAESSSDL